MLKLYILLYADDTIIMAETKEELQVALHAVGEYCRIWKLQVNVSKTKIIKFKKKKSKKFPNDHYDFQLNNEKVEVVDNYVYLGTTISYNGKYKEAIRKQVLQAQRALFAIKRKKEMYDLPFDITLDLFDKMIVPILLYGCEIWGFEDVGLIEVFYRKFLKYVLKVNKQTPSCMVYGESGKKPLNIIIKSRMICFWHKISVGNGNKLSSKLNYLAKKLYEQNQHSSAWIKCIEQTLNSCGMGHVWMNPEGVNYTWLKDAIEQRLSDMYIQDWHSQVGSMRSCTSYRLFKPDFKREEYLALPNHYDRVNICKFRCRNVKIPVVTLGYAQENVEYENRKCQLCDTNELGDEYHYILKCPTFQAQRNRYLTEFYTGNPNRNKLSQLFQSSNTTVLSKLAKLIFEINKKFR